MSARDDIAPGTQPADRVEVLLRRCALRDAAALKELYDATSPLLLGCLLRILRRRALAEEALQDVFVRIWERSSQFDAYRGRAMAWLHSIARYRAIDLLRRQRSWEVPDDGEADSVADESSDDAETLMAGDRMRDALSRCMQQLTDQQRHCLSLAFVDGYSHDEIARNIGTPLGSVKSWIRRGLLSLRRCLA